MSLVAVFMRLTTRYELLGGEENIPREGAGIVVVNHLGRLEGPLVYILVNRLDMTGWVADKYKNNALVKLIVNVLEGIWLHREDTDFGAIKQAWKYLQEGRLLGIAPEGTRSKTGELIEGKEGVAYLAAKSGVPIIPVAVTGSESVSATWLKLKRPKMTIEFGEPFTLPKLDKHNRDEVLSEGTDEIMCRIAALLPPEYRGIYSEHKRLKQLLSSNATVTN